MAYDDVTPYYQQSNGGGFGSNAYDDSPAYGNDNNISKAEPLAQSRSAPPKSGALADAIKEGWTLKKGPQTLAGWKKRYLQLSGNKQLGYYTDETMVQKKGTIFLSGLTIHHIKRSSKTSDSKHHGFCVVTEKRTFQFCVANATDRDHWIQKIREIVDEKWDAHKIDKPSISYSSSQRAKELQLTSGKVGNFSTKPNNAKQNKTKYGYNNGAYSNDEEWDDDDEPDTSNGRTLKIKNNLLADQNNNNNNNNFTGSSSNGSGGGGMYDDEKEDRFAHRSKYKRRNQQQQQQVMLSEQEAKEQIQELEHENEAILDEALRTTYETQTIAADTAQKLDEQRHQLIGIDKNLHEIDQDLDKTEGILDGMKSWGGMIKRKFKKNKDQQKEAYQAPVNNKSTFERREKEQLRNKYNGNSNNDNNGMPTQISQYEHDNRQNEKLDELLKNVKQLNATANDINTELDEQDAILDSIGDKMDKVAPRIQQQNHTMHKIIN